MSMPETTTLTQEAPDAIAAEVPRNKLYGLMAEFATVDAIFRAAERIRDAGYRHWDTMTPFPVHGLDKAMGIKATFLPVLVFGGGLTGAIIGFVLQWFTNATGFEIWAIVFVEGYEFFISGKPMLSGSVYPIVMFEMTILLSAFAAVGLMLLLNGLPRWYHPCFKSDRFARVTDDRFFLVLEAKDPRFQREQCEALLESLQPLSIEALEV